ncbi:MAG TPA: hypothetical protein VL381_10455 [Rhodocyclaceae bacterium]|nr:hypothetical protein [Rhodocyclaceae bacterium]
MRKLLIVIAMLFGLIAQAEALNSTAVITADNHYGLFIGNATGSNLQFIGRNEIGPYGSAPNGGSNWYFPEAFSFDARPGDYLYVVAWDDRQAASGSGHFLMASFTTPNGVVVTTKSDWVFKSTDAGFPGDYGPVPPTADLLAMINSGSWSDVQAEINQSYLLSRGNFDPQTRQIWSDAIVGASTGYVLFRSDLVISDPLPFVVAEPDMLAIFGIGVLGCVAGCRRKKVVMLN